MKVRVSEHQSVSSRTENPIKGTILTSAKGHMLICDQQLT